MRHSLVCGSGKLVSYFGFIKLSYLYIDSVFLYRTMSGSPSSGRQPGVSTAILPRNVKEVSNALVESGVTFHSKKANGAV